MTAGCAAASISPLTVVEERALACYSFVTGIDVCPLGCNSFFRAPGFGGTATKSQTPYPAPKSDVANSLLLHVCIFPLPISHSCVHVIRRSSTDSVGAAPPIRGGVFDLT